MCRACTVFVQSVHLLRSAPYSLMIVSVLAKPETIRDVPCWPSAQTPSPSIERVMPGYAASAVRGPRKAGGRAFHARLGDMRRHERLAVSNFVKSEQAGPGYRG